MISREHVDDSRCSEQGAHGDKSGSGVQHFADNLGLGAQWVTIHIPEAFHKVLQVPDLLTFYLIIPLGWPAVDRRPGWRRELNEIVHHDQYDRNLYMTNEQAYEWLYRLRGATLPKYRESEVDVTQQEQAARDK